MLSSLRARRRSSRRDPLPVVDLAPLIDIVFILLIFFLMTATFSEQRGLDLTPPSAETGAGLTPTAARVVIGPSGILLLDGEPMADHEALRARLLQRRRAEPDLSVVVVPDRRIPTGWLVEAIDTVRRARIPHVAIAATPPEPGDPDADAAAARPGRGGRPHAR